MSAANTIDVFRAACGKTVLGVYEDGKSEHAGRVVVLVLSDGSGLAFGTGNGSHWTVSREEVAQRVRVRQQELERLHRDLENAMKLEGMLP